MGSWIVIPYFLAARFGGKLFEATARHQEDRRRDDDASVESSQG